MHEYNFICGGIKTPKDISTGDVCCLDVQGKNKNVELKIEAISKAVMGNIPDELLDLLEIGAYVYCADQKASRGSEKLTDYGSDWRRVMNFVIPVRNPALWNSDALKSGLKETLGFLAGETYSFRFMQATQPMSQLDRYFDFVDDPITPDEVALFSGGIDSFAGAVESIAGNNKRVALVGHHSANKVKSVQTNLINGLKAKGYAKNIQYISIGVRNSHEEAHEYTQRTRSFLFACLAMGVAHMYGKDRFSFYENGVVSLNLPITKDVLESRSTRTTHPRAINGFQEIFSNVLKKPVIVEHPFRWLTKAAVTRKIKQYGCEDLLGETNSCTRPRSWTQGKNHCGVCSQCIDRRFGILAAEMEQNDNADKYKIDLLCGVRSQDDAIVMAASYVKFAQEFSTLTKERFVTEHPQLSSALSEFDGLSTLEAEQKIFDLYKEHSVDVLRVIENGFEQHKKRLLEGTLPSTCILSIFFNNSKIDGVPMTDVEEQLKSTMDRLSVERCRFFFDGKNSETKIVFRGGFELTGVNANLIAALIPSFREGKQHNREIDCIHAGTLAGNLSVEEQSLRQTITRLRKEVEERLGKDQGLVLNTDAFIENVPAKGYRLNKNLREVMSVMDLED
ncbi:MAG: 7-cyano-7-deazaguanine synthase [Alphaproteobacteria bacterium]|nr:MAG: 7-cyano-7-deazaguanine synthase [Alphaproteobacteria bacterium]